MLAPRPERRAPGGLSGQGNADRAMIRAGHVRQDERVGHAVDHRVGYEEIVNPPSDIAAAGTGLVVPPGVLLGFVVEMSERIDETIGQQTVDPRAFLGQEAGIGLVLFWPGQIDGPVCGIDITAQDDVLLLFADRVQRVQAGVVEIHFVLQTLGPLTAVGEVDVHQHEIGVMGHDDPALIVEFFDAEPRIDAFGLDLAVQGRAAVALSLAGTEETFVAVDVQQFIGQLFGVGLGLLQAQDIRLFGVEPLEKVLLQDRPNPIDIP